MNAGDVIVFTPDGDNAEYRTTYGVIRNPRNPVMPGEDYFDVVWENGTITHFVTEATLNAASCRLVCSATKGFPRA